MPAGAEVSRPPSETEQSLSLGQLAGQAWRATRELMRSDEAIQASGLLGGAALGATVAITVEGMPTRPTAAQEHAAYTGGQTRDGAAPPMANASHTQEATVAGLTGLGFAAAFIYTGLRARANR